MARFHHPVELEKWPAKDHEDLGHFKIFRLSRTTRVSPSTGHGHDFIGVSADDWVNLIALTAECELLLVRQYRHGTDEVTLEIPGGAVDPGEDPARAAARELEEETGYRPGEVLLLGSVEPNPAFLDNRCWTYLALDCVPDGSLPTDGSEEIEVSTTTVDGFTDLIESGEIRHSLVIAAHDHLRRRLARDPDLRRRLGASGGGVSAS